MEDLKAIGIIFISLSIIVFILYAILYAIFGPEFRKKYDSIYGGPTKFEDIRYKELKKKAFNRQLNKQEERAMYLLCCKRLERVMEEIMKNEQHSPLFEGTAGDYKIPDYMERMVEEKTELQERIEKLTVFIRSERNLKLSKEEYEDLLLQRSAMQEYLIVLDRRLQRAFEKEGM